MALLQVVPRRRARPVLFFVASMQARGLLAGSWATWGRVPGACVSVRGVAAGLRNGDSAWLGRERRRSMVYRQYPFEVSPKERTTNEGPRGTKQITSNVFVTNNVGSKFIMLNRPEVNNALNLEMLEDITDVYFKVPSKPPSDIPRRRTQCEGCSGL
ncbi:hypothetical protein T484DRAFT_2320848 [Baffinella frigidus]|nr:hypothetical protein T484DRAFT_2320848 [Cryptophyta sp. CCMP2293]